MARTIDNLGLDISTQYAENREAFDEWFIKDSRGIQGRTKVDVTLPFLPSEFETLFGLGERGAIWPAVSAPPRYYSSRRRLFAEQIIPGLGSPEAQENKMERLESFGKDEVEKHPNPKDAEEIGKEHETLLKLLGTIHILDTDLLEINPKRVQYQKG